MNDKGNRTIKGRAMKQVPAAIFVHDDNIFLKDVIEAFKPYGEVFVFVSRLPWAEEPGDWEGSVAIAEESGATVVVGNWGNESLAREAVSLKLRELGHDFIFIPDSDEIPEPALIDKLVRIAEGRVADRVRVRMDTYWKTTSHVVRPPEGLAPVLLVNIGVCEHRHLREYTGGTELLLEREHGVLHHLSYVGPDSRILKKVSSWSHKHEVGQSWWKEKWLAWDDDPCLRDLHPTHPPAYRQIERRLVPDVLRRVSSGRPVAECPEPGEDWPTVSVVVPLYGGEDDIRECLASLEGCQDLLHEVVVVDDVSPDGAAEVAEGFEFAKVVRREENGGFAAACNEGLANATGEIVVFLNSDTVVPRAGLVRLVESLTESGSVGATGPVSNNVGYYQRIDPTYESLQTMGLFAIDLASAGAPGKDVDMLVGFCLAVKRKVLDEVGGFDTRFGKGFFEDNDLCYRIQCAGYRLRQASSAFVHHSGSKSVVKVMPDPSQNLAKNQEAFVAKWRHEVDSGFASHLPSAPSPLGPVTFDRSKDPFAPGSEVTRLREKARVSLCMIVRNEERVVRDCLQSAKPFFFETVVVDTGSTDRTIEILREEGVKVVESAWPDSFAEARNESLRHATGDWIFWLDADDTLPWASGIAVLRAAVEAPPHLAGFVVPVQFVEGAQASGTRVDHVKLFRNAPGVQFEGRIHEQVLPSLRPIGDIARIDAVVLHSGYDTSDTGQARKRERDWHLLALDLKERPDHPFVLFNYGMTHHYCGDHEEAVEWFRKCLEHSKSNESHVRKVYALLGLSLKRLGKLGEAVETFEEGLKVCGEDPELRFHLGMHFAETGGWERAREEYLKVGSDVSGHFSSVDTGILGFKRDMNLGGVYLALGDYPAAREKYLSAIRSAPDFVEAGEGLFSAAMRNGDLKTAGEAAEHVRTVAPWSVRSAEIDWELWNAVGGEGLASNSAVAIVNQHGDHLGMKLVLARHLLRTGREPESLGLLQELAHSGVAEAAYYLGVYEVRKGQTGQALQWFKLAQQLDPAHEETVANISALEADGENSC